MRAAGRVGVCAALEAQFHDIGRLAVRIGQRVVFAGAAGDDADHGQRARRAGLGRVLVLGAQIGADGQLAGEDEAESLRQKAILRAVAHWAGARQRRVRVVPVGSMTGASSV